MKNKSKIDVTPARRNYLSEESRRLLDVSIEKGVLNWLTPLPINDFGFELLKQHLRNAIRLRYRWDIANLLTTCPVVVYLAYNIV